MFGGEHASQALASAHTGPVVTDPGSTRHWHGGFGGKRASQALASAHTGPVVSDPREPQLKSISDLSASSVVEISSQQIRQYGNYQRVETETGRAKLDLPEKEEEEEPISGSPR